jgi:hypothetical protein
MVRFGRLMANNTPMCDDASAASPAVWDILFDVRNAVATGDSRRPCSRG